MTTSNQYLKAQNMLSNLQNFVTLSQLIDVQSVQTKAPRADTRRQCDTDTG